MQGAIRLKLQEQRAAEALRLALGGVGQLGGEVRLYFQFRSGGGERKRSFAVEAEGLAVLFIDQREAVDGQAFDAIRNFQAVEGVDLIDQRIDKRAQLERGTVRVFAAGQAPAFVRDGNADAGQSHAAED